MLRFTVDDRPNAEPRLLRWVLPVLSLHAALALAAVVLWVLLAARDWLAGSDFTAFYAAWAIVRDGHGARLYDRALQDAYQAQLLDGAHFVDGGLAYVNPPHLTLPFVPLAWLPRPAALVVWTAGQFALLVWVSRWLLRQIAGDWRRHERWLLVSSLLAFLPLHLTFLTVTFSLLMLAALLRLYDCLKAGRDREVGVWLALATLKPQAALAPAAMLLAGRRWRTLAIAALALLALAVPATIALGPAIWPSYARLLSEFGQFFDWAGAKPALMYNLRGTLTLLLGNERGQLINTISWLAQAAGVLGVAWLWRGRWRPAAADFDLRLALTVVVGLLLSPHAYPHDALVLVLPAALLYAHVRRWPTARRWCGACLLAAPPIIFVAERTIGGGLGVRIPVLLAVGLAVWLGIALRRAGASSPLPAAAPDSVQPAERAASVTPSAR